MGISRRRARFVQLAAALLVATAGGVVSAGAPSRPSPPATPLAAATLTAALTAQGATVSDYGTLVALQGLRITVTAPDAPPPWPGDPVVSTTSSPTSGWVVWPLATPISGIVTFAHGCCNDPPDLAQQAGTIATGALVVAMDYRDASAYAPDIASEDSAAGTQLLEAALPQVKKVIAFGLSEGGAATALMIEHHPGLVSGWVDESGAVDAYAGAQLLDEDLRPLAQNVDTGLASTLLNLLSAVVGPTIDPVRLAAISPILHASLITGLSAAIVVHATGDLVVPFSPAAALAADLAAGNIPTKLIALVPAAGQPETSMAWHITAAGQSTALQQVKLLLSVGQHQRGLASQVLPAVAS